MNDHDKQISNQESNEIGNDNDNQKELSLSALTNENKLFIESLLSGKKTFDAYKLAGYSGNYKAAYELRRRMLPWIAELSGCSQADVFLSLRGLEDLGVETEPMSHETYLSVLKLKAKLSGMLKESTNQGKQYSTFVIQRFDSGKNITSQTTTESKLGTKGTKQVIDNMVNDKTSQ